MNAFTTLLAFVAIFAAGAAAQEPLTKETKLGDNWLIEKLDYRGEIAPGTTVELTNEYGEIRARGTVDQTVEIVANVQKAKGDQQLIFFRTREEEGKLVIEVVYEGDDEDTVRKSGKRRLDMTIYVPKTSLFVARTFKGQIDARGLGDADLYSERGKVFLRNKGHAKIVTRQGNIRAVLRKVDWDKPVHVESVVGNLEVELPREADFSVVATTMGRLTTDYSVDIKTNETSWMKTVRATVGSGKNEIVLRNQNGAIGLLRGRWSTED